MRLNGWHVASVIPQGALSKHSWCGRQGNTKSDRGKTQTPPVGFSEKYPCFYLLKVTRRSCLWRPRWVKVETSVSTLIARRATCYALLHGTRQGALAEYLVTARQSCMRPGFKPRWSCNGFILYIKSHMFKMYPDDCHLENCYICSRQ